MSNNQVPIDPKHLEFLMAIPKAAICGFRQHDGIEERLAAAEAALTASRERETALADILDRLATGYENLAELRLLDNPYLDETMRLVDVARAALAASSAAASSAAGKVEQ